MHKNKNKAKLGFTLLETLIAMIIMSTALLLLANSWSSSALRVKKAQLSFEIGSLLERKMSEIESKYNGKSIDEIQEEEEGDFGDEHPQYSWKLESKKLEFPGLAALLTSQEGGADQMTTMVMNQITEQLSKTIKEVKVTIVYKGSKKPLEFSATRYFVDYTKELNLGVPGAGQ